MVLSAIQYFLSSEDASFQTAFLSYISQVGIRRQNEVLLHLSNEQYCPRTSFIFSKIAQPFARFITDKEQFDVSITNETGQEKKSPNVYSHVPLHDFMKRIEAFKLLHIDHTGFNLPWFDGVHPKILELRQKLKDACLYHTFPKHLEDAPWDFILPGTREEIERRIPIDYSKVRKPKIEIVSFEGSSTPLIQIDICLDSNYETLSKLFPEALHQQNMKNMWVYIQNNFGIDICFVLNQPSIRPDWSIEFKNDRLD